ncbi:MAG: response regulator transcription factor [Nocardioides sp.]|uniref:response regulator n=1 Tax=Nocardioides sp. TaxID=35761 RepID=UPI0039E41395
MSTATMTARSQLRVAIVEDHVLFAESLELALSLEGYDVRRILLPAEQTSVPAMMASVLRQRPKIVLLDFDLGRFGDGARLVEPLARAGVDVVVVTGAVDEARWGQALRLGARTVLPKSHPLGEILGTVRRLHQGQSVLDVADRERLLKIWHQRRGEMLDLRARLDRLTNREAEVLGHLMRGETVSEIAVLGVVSEATVRTQVKSILAKLEVSSQIAAVGLAHRVGWKAPTG